MSVTKVAFVTLMRKVPLGKHLRMGLVPLRTNHVNRQLELAVPHPDLQGRED